MSGSKFLLDTNIVLYVLNGNKDLTDFLYGQKLSISIITEMELLSFHGLTKSENDKLNSFIGELEILPLNEKVKETAIKIRKKHRLKLPDSVIAATAIIYKLPVVTADKQLKVIDGISLLLYQNTSL